MRLLAMLVCLSACTAAAPSAPGTPRADAVIPPEPCQDGPTTPPPAGMKRFHVKLAKINDTRAWIEVDGKAYGLMGSELEGCFQVLLGPGQHALNIRSQSARRGAGTGLTLAIHEEAGEEGQWRYDTLAFQCGDPDACDEDQLADWKQHTDALPEHLHDPCGSTKVRRAQWSADRGADLAHIDNVAVQTVLDVYDFQPEAGPGACGKHPEPAEDE